MKLWLTWVLTVFWLSGCGGLFGGGVDVGGGLKGSTVAEAPVSPEYTVLSLGVAESVTGEVGVGQITSATIEVEQIAVELTGKFGQSDSFAWGGPFVIDLVHQTLYPVPVTVLLNPGWRINKLILQSPNGGRATFAGIFDGHIAYKLQTDLADDIVIRPQEELITKKDSLQVGLLWTTDLFFSQMRETYPDGFTSGVTQITNNDAPEAVDALRTTIAFGGQAVEQ